jgi:hypothetical protein
MDWQRRDLDFPVLMLETSPWLPSVASFGGSPHEGLCDVAVRYGDDEEELQLLTSARRGSRMSAQPMARWSGDDLPAHAGQALENLLRSTVPDATPRVEARRLMEEHRIRSLRLAQQLPEPPWQWRRVPVDGVDFAMWFTTLPQGFAAVLDCGPAILTAWGRDPDPWEWRLRAGSPDVVWSLIEAFDE